MTDSHLQNAQVDLRGFTYELAPYLRKQEWQMEQLENRLARLRQLLVASRGQCATLRSNFQNQAAYLQLQLQPRPDPQMHQRGLGYLSALQKQILEKEKEIEAFYVQKALLQKECLDQQRKIDGLKEHRAGVVQEYANDCARLAAAEADRNWIGRMHGKPSRSVEILGPLP